MAYAPSPCSQCLSESVRREAFPRWCLVTGSTYRRQATRIPRVKCIFRASSEANGGAVIAPPFFTALRRVVHATGQVQALTPEVALGTVFIQAPRRRIHPKTVAGRQSEADMKQTPRRVAKPWGYEIIWAETTQYVGKLLHIEAGEALSLQYHEEKDETIHLLSGEMRFSAGSSEADLQDIELRTGESFRVVPGTVHRMVAVSDCDVLEASTPHLEDVVRLEDRYGRTPGAS